MEQPHELVLCTRYLRMGLIESVSFAAIAYWSDGDESVRLSVMENEDPNVGILVHSSEPGEDQQAKYYHMFVERFMRSVMRIDPFKCEVIRLHLLAGSPEVDIPEFLKTGEVMFDVSLMDSQCLLSLERIHGPSLTDKTVLTSESRGWGADMFQMAPIDLIPDRLAYVSNVPFLFHPGLTEERLSERGKDLGQSWRM